MSLNRPRSSSRLRDFEGTERFEVIRHLGSGGMGVVYEAIDRRTGGHVALKTLSLRDATSIYRFKKEFRGLSDISHPNLAALFELFETDGQWFFTMELIKGRGDLLRYLRPALLSESRDLTENLSQVSRSPGPGMAPRVWTPPADLPRVRSSIAQLAEGLHALHAAGRLHRDIKPSNVLVSEKHRVVLVDFGLSTEFAVVDSIEVRAAVGTVSYMSPEQAALGVLGPASDWYSVGCILYQVLTGSLPFSGTANVVLSKKQEQDPTDPRDLTEGLPDDLSDLCMALLSRESSARPSGADVIGSLVADKGEHRPGGLAVLASSSQGDCFVGRECHLRQLSRALECVIESARPRCVLVYGGPGMGKTALLRQFCDAPFRTGHDSEQEVVVLSGRCYERESVPYKAVDTIVDSLSRYLGGLSESEVLGFLPSHTNALIRLFPVLKTVRAVAKMRRGGLVVDPQVARRQALVALRQLLGNVGRLRPIVLWIDDFQWCDTDSASLLASFFGTANAPNVLLLLSYRGNEAKGGEALAVLVDRLRASAKEELMTSLPLDRLSEEEAQELASIRMGAAAQHNENLVERVAAESQGNPFFVEEMTRYLLSGAGGALPGDHNVAVTLRETMIARLDGLTAQQRKLLDVVAVAGVPIPEAVALCASGAPADAYTVIPVLRSGKLLRSNRDGLVDKLESYHGRMQELLVELAVPESPIETYRHIARAFEQCASSEHESITAFYVLAGDLVEAAEHARIAADRAMEALAFKRAAMHYEIALRGVVSDGETLELRKKLAVALSHAGLGEEAAVAHLVAAALAPPLEAVDQRRRAAESLMRAGHVDRAVELFRNVLGTVGLRFPESNRRAFFNLLLLRVILRIRGVGFRERDAAKLPVAQLIKIDVCGSCGLGFGVNDSFRGAEFQTRQVLLALRAGEPGRVGLSLAIEAAYRSLEGKKGRVSAESLIARARELGTQVGDPVVQGFAQYSEALAAYQCGEWRQALGQFDEAARILLRECRGQQANACQAERLAADALFFLGEIRRFSEFVPNILEAAEERGDLHGATDMRTGSPNIVWLVRDNVAQARLECERGEKQWSARRFFLQHYYAALAHINIDLYEGQGRSAVQRIETMWRPLKKSFLLRVAVVGAQATFLRGRALIAAASQETGRKRAGLLASAVRQASSLRTMKIPCAGPWSTLLCAQVALLRGHTEDSVKLLRRARAGLKAQDMMLCFHACSFLLGTLLMDSQGGALREAACRWAHSQGIESPEKFMRIMVPLA